MSEQKENELNFFKGRTRMVMKKQASTDYSTYKEVMDELNHPIDTRGLDPDTIKRLYESKLVYLENLRVKCFFEINQTHSEFLPSDYQLILQAIRQTNQHLRELILVAMDTYLSRRKVS